MRRGKAVPVFLIVLRENIKEILKSTGLKKILKLLHFLQIEESPIFISQV